MSEPIEIRVFLAVRTQIPHETVLVVPSEGAWSLPNKVFESGSFDDTVAEILDDLGAGQRQACTFTQVITVGDPSMVAVLYVSHVRTAPFYRAPCEWMDPVAFSLPVDRVSGHFVFTSLRINDVPYKDLGTATFSGPPVLLPGQRRFPIDGEEVRG
jgi:hypothetical protein